MAQLHEFKSKRILAANGVEVPRGRVAATAGEARAAADGIAGPVVVKAQVHSTSRAAAGGIRFAGDGSEAEVIARELIGGEIAGNRCEAVLVEEKLPIAREFYVGFIVDTALKRPALLFSASGGSGIEDRAGSMRKLVCSVRSEPAPEEVRALVGSDAGEDGDAVASVLLGLYRAALSCEARSAEINPLARLSDGRLLALDARISVDDYAVFRHPDLGIEMARELGHTPTRLERIAWDVEKDDFRGTFYFVEIEGGGAGGAVKIGFHGAGGGGSMASLDAAQRNGLGPACYVDTSGNPPASKVYRAARIILSIPGIRGYFLSGSGVASQEQFVLARAVLKAFLEVRPDIPAVLRLGGNGEDAAKDLVERYAGILPAPIEAYRKRDTADFCAARLGDLIAAHVPKQGGGAERPGHESSYSFKTKTGEVSFDYSQMDQDSSAKIVESCPQKILEADGSGRPVLAVGREEAERGKCSECLACEFASLDMGRHAVKIDFPTEGL